MLTLSKTHREQQTLKNAQVLLRDLDLWNTKGAFINDVTQVGGRGCQYICYTIYKVIFKLAILVWQRGEGGQKKSNFARHHFWMTPNQLH